MPIQHHCSHSRTFYAHFNNVFGTQIAGKFLMVSAFLCECHGLLRLSPEQELLYPDLEPDSTEIIKPGSGGDGFWTNADLVRQTKLKAIPIFKALYPGCDALFVFDNSANHHAFAPDAIVA